MEVGVRALGMLLMILDWLLRPLYYLRYGGRSQPLPPPRDPLLLRSAIAVAEMLRNGEVTSEQLVTIYIERVKQVEPLLNAVVEERYSAALAEARRADCVLAERRGAGTAHELELSQPLLGVPFTVKESCSLAGMSNSVGCLEFRGRRATADGATVSRVRAAGAIPLLVTNTPELCLGWESVNLLRGATNNPYDLNRTSGGSSGGEGALISSAASLFGVASDIAGSIRLPSTFTGVFGHKPTPGVIPIEGHIPTLNDENYSRFLAVGPMARHAGDLALLTAIMAGDKADLLRLDEPVQLDKVKVRYMTEAGWSWAIPDVDPEIKERLRDAVRYLSSQCHAEVVEEKFKELEDSVELSVAVFFGMKDIPNLLLDPFNPKRQKNLLVEIVKSLFGLSVRSLQALGFAFIHATNLFIPRAKYDHYCRRAQNLQDQFQRTLGEDGVFLYPAYHQTAHRHNQVFTKAAGVMYTMMFNILGMPATSVPLGLDSRGLPIGIQVVAAPYQDRLCLAVAKQLEIGFGGWKLPH